jgi:hypothetical protein
VGLAATLSLSCSLVLPSNSQLLGGDDSGPGMLLFDEEFDAAPLDLTKKWVVAGNGAWSIEGGTGIQSNPSTTTSMIYAKEFVGAADYHIVARMRSTGPFGQGYALAPEIAFRVDPTVDAGGIPESYHCDFNLLQDQLIVDQTTPNNTAGFGSVDADVPAADETMPFVLDAVVSGDAVTCTLTVDGLDSGTVETVTTNQLERLTGSFGLKTYQTSAQFFYFRVYAAK